MPAIKTKLTALEKKKRKRTRTAKPKLSCGDILKAELPGVSGKHICIILKDDTTNGHQECLPVCNMTGSYIAEGEYAIDISKYDLPDEWFEKKKPDSWIRCNTKDCVWSINFEESDILGNIKNDYPELWNDVCKATVNCEIAERLNEICDCEYEEIQAEILNGNEEEFDCGCET